MLKIFKKYRYKFKHAKKQLDMKKSFAIMLMISFSLISYFIISCKHEIPVTCQGVTIDITTTATPDTLNGHKGSVEALATSGGTTFTYSINGTTFQSNGIFSGLKDSTYTITAKNENGCTGTTDVTIGNIADPCTTIPSVNVTTTHVDPTTGQSNGSIAVTAPTGAGTTYSKDGTNYQSSNLFSGLAAGNYTIYAKTGYYQCIGSVPVTLSSVANPCTGVTISVSTTSVTAATTKCTSLASDYGTVVLSASGASGAFTYSKNGTTFQASSTFTSLAPGTYTFTAKSTAGCTGTVQATVLYTPTVISFATSVLPKMQACLNCHGSYSSYTGIKANAERIAGRLIGNTTAACRCVFNTSTTYGSFNMHSSAGFPTNWALTVYDQWVIQGKLNN